MPVEGPALRNPQRLNDNEFAWILRHVPVLRAWLQSVEAEAFHRLMQGKNVVGFKLVQGRAYRKWKDTKKVLKLLKTLGFTDDEVQPRELLSPAQVERIIRSKKKLSEWGRIEKLIDRPMGKVSIAPLHDPRHRITRGSEFEGVTIDMED